METPVIWDAIELIMTSLWWSQWADLELHISELIHNTEGRYKKQAEASITMYC